VTDTPPPTPGLTQIRALVGLRTSANGFAGADGSAVLGVTGADAGDGSEVFTAFVAVTEKRYSVLLVSPVTTQLSAGAVAVQVNPPGEEVAVYEVIALWLSPGADHETVALSEPPTALGVPGAFGFAAAPASVMLHWLSTRSTLRAVSEVVGL